ncbi:hypothetical protein Naga_100054g32 [Nannochloropsis gaditana]|uniref:Uncharacterized protein n=1 Tax=Nannochloropsis gaditana TaxID=72520 RepID=W7TFR7_9STRA|nr:hypothetical protein Naga_100054g32 [Nannochloropsis gaditana]
MWKRASTMNKAIVVTRCGKLHIFPVFFLTTRRSVSRSIKAFSSSSTSAGQVAPETIQVDFGEATGALFDRIEKGVAGMQELNDFFVVNRQNKVELVIDLGPGKGAFTLQRDWAHNQLVYLSPVSGCNKYEYEQAGRRWLSIAEDKHDLTGILTRDLIRMCVGCPEL